MKHSLGSKFTDKREQREFVLNILLFETIVKAAALLIPVAHAIICE